MRNAPSQKSKMQAKAIQAAQMVSQDLASACMSAPCKNSGEAGMFHSSQVKSDRLQVMVEKDAISRFSSCTAKTSPSTDNNSSGNPAVQEDRWDSSLQAKIRQHNALRAADGSETPTRVRACSDTPLNNVLRDEVVSNTRKPIDALAGIHVSTRSSHQRVEGPQVRKLDVETIG